MNPVTVTLIGMPGAGKSTVGVLLAKRIGLNFVDSDLLIQVQQQETLQSILETRGYQALREIEENIILEVPLQNCLVATGGSVVYSADGMRRLKQAGPVVYLSSSLPVLEERVKAHRERGIASSPGQSFADVYRERLPLYQRYADLTVPADEQSAEATAVRAARELGYG